VRKLFVTAFSIVSFSLLSGCTNICGQWESVKVYPEGATQKFNMGKVILNCNGTFDATMQCDGKDNASKGTYNYSWGTLSLKTEEGKTRKYKAKVSCCSKMMVVSHSPHGQEEIKITMKKTGCAPDCDKSKCKKGCSCSKADSGCGKKCGKGCKSSCGDKK